MSREDLLIWKWCGILALLILGAATVSEARADDLLDLSKNPETYVVCKTVDVASTIYIVQHGGRELNPLLAPSVNAHHYFPMIALGVGLYYLIKWLNSDTTTEVVNAVTCGVAIHNVLIL